MKRIIIIAMTLALVISIGTAVSIGIGINSYNRETTLTKNQTDALQSIGINGSIEITKDCDANQCHVTLYQEDAINTDEWFNVVNKTEAEIDALIDAWKDRRLGDLANATIQRQNPFIPTNQSRGNVTIRERRAEPIK